MTESIDTPVDESLLRGDVPAETDAVVEGEDRATPAAEVKIDSEPEAKPEQKHERDQMIPRSRFDEVYRQAKEREEENAQLRAALEAKNAPEKVHDIDIKALRQDAYHAMLEGDSDKYAEISEQIDRELVARAKAEAKAEFVVDNERRETVSKLESVAAQAMADYPFLDPETGDAQAIDEVIGWRDMYIAKGIAPHIALSQAVQKVAPLYQTAKVEIATDDRSKNALQRAISAAERQPPATGQIGIGQRGEDKAFNAANIDQKDWENLSDDDRKKLLAA